MIFAIEAVNYDLNGNLARVRWHSIDLRDSLVHGPSAVVDVAHAVEMVERYRVHVCYHGAPGTQVVVGTRDGQKTLVDLPETPANQRLERLPRFE